MRWTIQRKLTVWYAGLLLLVLVVLGVVLYQVLGRSLLKEATNSVIALSQQIIVSIGSSEHGESDEGDEGGSHFEISDPDLIRDYESPGIFIEIHDTAGSILNRSPELRGKSLTGGEPESILADSDQGLIEIRDLPQIGPVLVHSQPLTIDGFPAMTLLVGRSIQFIDDALAQLQPVLLLLSAAGLALAVAVGAVLARQALAPIDRITKTARRIGVEDLHRRLHLKGPNGEVTRLAGAFDEMLDRVEVGFRRERQFSADVAHELRTPLTILKGTAEVALRQGEEDPHAHREVLASIEEETDRMIRMVEALLLLTRSESGQLPLTLHRVSLADLCVDVVTRFSTSARERGIKLATGQLEDVAIDADVERLQQLLGNLVANGLAYTPRGGRITLSVRRDNSWAVIAVADTGAGISAEHLPHIFDRFYRVDLSRSRRLGGAGLGLSIALSIAEAHGGRIAVTSQAAEGSVFSVWLPVLRP